MTIMTRAFRSLVWSCAAVAILGCESATEEETASDGRIQVSATTGGAAPQSAGYLVTLDGARPATIAPNGSTIYDSVPPGGHAVHLFPIADNCVVAAPNPRSVDVSGGDLKEISFSVACGPPITGGFRVLIITTGPETDEDGYQLSVAGTPLRPVAVNGTETYEGLEPGVHLVTLKDVADTCDVQGGNPQPYTVVVGKSVQIVIRVSCGEGDDPLN